MRRMKAVNDFRYILFDLDGTLTDSGLGITNSVMYALGRFGISVEDRSELYRFIGPPLLSSFKEFYGFDASTAEKAVEYYREYYSVKGIFESTVYDGIPELLKQISDSGRKSALATSKPEKYAVQILDRFGLSQYFSNITGASMTEARTDKAELISLALSALDIKDKSSAVMIGDRRFDIYGARANGIASTGVLYGYGSREELTGAGADFIAEAPQDIAGIIGLKGTVI